MSLEIERGSIFGLIGPSGSGKTTAIRLLTGLRRPSSGSAWVLGRNPTRFTRADRARLGYLPQISVLFPRLTVDQNLRFFASLYGLSGKSGRHRRLGVLELVELASDRKKRVEEISGGMQRRLSLAASIVHDPELAFLDEPTAGVDPVLRRRFWDHLGLLRDAGRTLFVTTQYVGEAAYCDYVGVLSDGRLLMVDTPEGLQRAAYGGDVIELVFDKRPTDGLAEELKRLVSARSVTRNDSSGLRLVVGDIGKALPTVTEWLSTHQIGVRTAGRYQPPLDDVFVELVRQHRIQLRKSDVG